MSGARGQDADIEGTSDAVGEVLIELGEGSFGVGGVARPGTWTGIRLRIDDPSAEARELLVRVAGTDPDGDTPMYEQVVATGGGAVDAWAYVRLPTGLAAGDLFAVSAFEAIATEDPERPYRAGRFVGRAFVGARLVVEASDGLIGVVNQRGSLGLSQFSLASQQGSFSPLGNERTEVVSQLGAESLPDRWMGLSGFEAIVWGDVSPTGLGTERPAAIAEWVLRGGHLVVVLPESAQEWTSGANPLQSILPRVSVRAVESSYPIDSLMGLFDWTRSVATLETPDPSVVVRELIPDPTARSGEAMAILSDREGRVLVSRRLVGQGMVTLVGINLNARGFLKHNLPRAEAFWSRILGRRGQYKSIAELNDPTTDLGKLGAMSRSRDVRWYDDDVASLIATSGRSAAALLLAFVTFTIYWGAAGPVGYWVLKRFSLVRHAWVMFLAMAGVFTLIAWSGAFALRPKSVSARHVSIIDHVYEQPVQRAIAWMSLLVPYYGEGTLRVADPAEGALIGTDRLHNLVAPWSPRQAREGEGRFPDVRGYSIDARDPDRVTFPTRATVKQLEVQWAGEALAAWRMPRPVLPEGAGDSGEPRLSIDDRGFARGVLRHDLAGDLVDVVVIAARRQNSIGTALRDGLFVSARAAKRLRWAPGEAWDLASIDATGWEPLNLTLDALVPQARGALSAGEETLFGTVEERLLGMSLFHLLEPPAYTVSSTSSATLPRRWQMHGWDLSKWLTQPCIIVIGHMNEDAPSPVPMVFGSGGREFPTRGRTLVRWVYPLEADPPDWVEIDGAGGG